MDSKNGGQYQYSNDLQRQATASIARKKVLAAYANAAKKSFEDHTDNASAMKKERVNTTVNAEAWKRYHSAWQEYYQKYYSDYYSNAAKNYVEKERLKDARLKAEEEEILKPTENEDQLRKFIRKKATDSARKSRRHRKLIPIFAGITVVLLILFLQYNRLIFAPIMAYVAPSSNAASEIESIDPTIVADVSKDPKLIIPKINVDVPIHFGIQLSEVMPAMNNGVAHYRIAGASAFPGELGNLVITGHSAGDIYSSNPYKFIFSGLERLDEGDLIYVNYEGVRYTYSITKKQVIDPSNVQALVMGNDKPLITLVTCTPLGTSNYRLLVTGEQISPSHETATRNPDDAPVESPTEGTIMPANEPSFFEGIWNWLTGK